MIEQELSALMILGLIAVGFVIGWTLSSIYFKEKL